MNRINNLKLLNDNEIREIYEDNIDFVNYAETLRTIILNATTPITIGIHGEWGSGKSSLMRITNKLLKEDAKTIWFNAWKYDETYDLRAALIQTILYEIGKDEKLIERVADLYKKINYLSLIKLVASNAFGRLNLDIENIVNKNAELTYIGDFDVEFNELVKRYANNQKLVIFIDDLDRCLPDKILDILEAIKLFLDADGCVFVIGANKDIIEDAIKINYNNASFKSIDYMEKLVQLPFNLPMLREMDSEKFIEKIAPTEIKKYSSTIAKVGGNPRRLKRIINKFIFQTILSENIPEINNKIKLDMLAKFSVLELRWAVFYSNILKFCDENLCLAIEKIEELGPDERISYGIENELIKFLKDNPPVTGADISPYIYLRSASSYEEEFYVSDRISDLNKFLEVDRRIRSNERNDEVMGATDDKINIQDYIKNRR
ncbi:MAG: KAP family P-loop NTPase fold protein [Eubacteriales bacterium]